LRKTFEELTLVFRREDLQQYLLSDWLWMETVDIVLYQATYHRLHYEARTWRRTYGGIISLIDKSLADIDQLGTAIGGWLEDSRAGRLTAGSRERIISDCKNGVPVFPTLVNPPRTPLCHDLLKAKNGSLYWKQYGLDPRQAKCANFKLNA